MLNYLINRQLRKKKRLAIKFMNIKAAFDSVDRKVLVDSMREREVRKGGWKKF